MKDNRQLGKLVEEEDRWYRVAKTHLSEKFIKDYEEENDCVFTVVIRGYYGNAVWGFSKHKSIKDLTKENGKPTYLLRKWSGKDLGIKFENGAFINIYIESPDIPIKICNEGRCEGTINMEGDRCEGRKYEGKFCAPCSKYEKKKLAGKLKECRFCKSTYHSTRSCKLNPKVIEKELRFQEMLRNLGYE